MEEDEDEEEKGRRRARTMSRLLKVFLMDPRERTRMESRFPRIPNTPITTWGGGGGGGGVGGGGGGANNQTAPGTVQ